MLPKVDGLGLQILFTLLPGIIALGIIKSIGPKRPRTDFESGLHIFVYGVVAYILTGVILAFYDWLNEALPVGRTLWHHIKENSLTLSPSRSANSVDETQILIATIVGALIGCLVSVLQTYSLPHRVLRFLRLTKRTNEVDVWGFAFNSTEIDSWVNVRHSNGKIYQGWVRAYSEGSDERELLLVDVNVYVPDARGELTLVDSTPVLYLGLDKKGSLIEMRTEPNSDKEKANGK